METSLAIPEAQTPEQKTALQEYMALFDWKEIGAQVRRGKELTVTDAGQAELIAEARTLRLGLKRVRTAIENRRKELKEGLNLRSKAIDGMANVLKELIVPAEDHLEAQERFVELQEEKRLAELQAARQEELSKYLPDTSFYDLKSMSEQGFQGLLESSRVAWQARKDAEAKAAAERADKEKADAAEAERLKAENARLQKENEEAARKAEAARKEKEKAEADARALKEEQERKDKEALAAKEKLEREQREAARRAKLAPDKEKLEGYATALAAVPAPEVKSEEAKAVVADAIKKVSLAVTFLKQRAAQL